MPLSSGLPGVHIEPESPSSSTMTLMNTVVRKLTIGREMWNYLPYGDNTFVCKAVNLNGEQHRQQFVVRKVSYSAGSSD